MAFGGAGCGLALGDLGEVDFVLGLRNIVQSTRALACV